MYFYFVYAFAYNITVKILTYILIKKCFIRLIYYASVQIIPK
jgi:hypothetical protein